MKLMPARILLVEDNDGDAELVLEAMADCKLVNDVKVVATGEAALDYLHRKGEYADTDVWRPDLIILDLNLPGISGRDVLKQIKVDRKLATIPVVVMTTSRDEADVLRTYQLHANCFISKPVDMDRFIEVVQRLDEFWFTIVRLPDRGTDATA
jgi:CheY-like chemotaxis protein